MTKFVGTPLRGFDFNSVASEALSARVHSDSVPRIRIDAGGKITWGSGSAAGDTNLYRDSANTLTTDDVFVATGGMVTLTTNGVPNTALPDGALAVDTTNHVFYYRSNSTWTEVTSGGATLTVSDTKPTVDIVQGDLWFESDSGRTFVYYDSFWVEIGAAGYASGGQGQAVDLLNVSSDIIPSTTNTYSLGSPTKKWEEVFIGPNSLYIEDAVTGGNAKFTVSNGTLLVNNAAVSTSIGSNSVTLGTHTTGSYVQSLVAGTGVTLSNNSGEGATPTIAIGQSVATNANVTFNDVTVAGNLLVSGATVTVNSETLTIDDNIIVLNNNEAGTPSQNAGIEVERGTSANVAIRWNESTDKWETTNDGSTYSVIATNGNITLGTDTSGNYVSDITAGTGVSVSHTPGEGSSPTVSIGQAVSTSSSVTFASVTAPLIGNASTATTLQNARTISLGGDLSGSVSFNGSTDVTISATIQPNSVALGTDTTGNYMSDVSAGTGISVSHTQSEGSTATISLNAHLDNLTDVTITGTPTDKQLLVYDNATSQWKNADPITSTGIAYKSGVPASKTSTGTLGQLAIDGANGVLYICTGVNTWQKVSLNSANFTNVGGFA